MDRKVMKFGGKDIAFQNYYPEQDLSWIGEAGYEKVDVLFNHYTHGNRYFTGQAIDNSKFGVMIFGDIHKPFRSCNMLSVGNPLGHRLGDCQDGTMLILDTENIGTVPGVDFYDGQHTWVNEFGISYKWVPVIVPGKWDFLRIARPDCKYTENLGQYKYDVIVPYAEVADVGSAEASELVNSLDWEAILGEKLTTDDLKRIHREVMEAASLAGKISEPVSLNFRLIRTKVRNYRSIDEFTFMWGGGTTLVSGPFGSGKTSFVRAMIFSIFGDRNVRECVRNTMPPNDYLEVDQTLEYGGIFYRINRGFEGSGFVQVWAGTEEEIVRSYLDEKDEAYYKPVDRKTSTDRDAFIREKLRFMDLWRLVYVDQYSTGVMSGMNENDRTAMLSMILGWEQLLVNHGIVNSIVAADTKSVAQLEIERAAAFGKFSAYQELNLVADDTDWTAEKAELTTKSQELNAALVARTNYDLAAAGVASDKERFETLSATESVDVTPLRISNLMVSKDELIADKEKLKTSINDLDPAGTAMQNRKRAVDTAAQDVARLTAEMEKSQDGYCAHCEQSIPDPEKAAKHRAGVQLKLDEATARYDAANEVYVVKSSGSSGIPALKLAQDAIDAQVKSIDSDLDAIKSYNRVLGEIATLRTKLDAYTLKWGNISVISDEEVSANRASITEIDQKVGFINAKIQEAKDVSQKLEEMRKAGEDVESLESRVVELNSKLASYQEYSRLTAIAGPVVRSVLEESSKILSTDVLKVRTVKTLSSGEPRPDLSLEMMVGKHWINYSNLSGGQVATADMMFLMSLIRVAGGSGLLVLDETFKFLSIEAIDEFGKILSECAAHDRFVITHAESFVYADRVLMSKMSPDGITSYEFRNLN
jgi:hypothetical protein